ncbi:MAG: hypothetical protein ACR2LJ_09270 [Acidimicrobiales bacterium]
MKGGSANDYDYCSGDPVNCRDLDGTKRRPLTPEEQVKVDRQVEECGNDRYIASFCVGFLKANAKGDLTAYGFGFVPDKRKYVHCPSWLKVIAQTAGVGGVGRAYNQFGYDKGKAARTLARTAGVYGGEEIAFRVARIGKYGPYVTAGATAVDAVCTNF